MGKYSIKDVETLSGIQAHTLRIWEQRYNFIQPERTDTNIRYYSDQQLIYILNVAFLNQTGYKISKLAKMSSSEINDEIAHKLLVQESDDINIHALHSSMIDFDEAKFNLVISNSIEKNSFEHTVNNLILPFLEKIGVLWRIGTINPAQEHFMTSLIRQKIIVAIDGLPTNKELKNKRCILYLPEGEFHELPLLLACYKLKKHNHQIIYMGASLPLLDLKKAIEFTKPEVLLTIVTISMHDQTIDEYLDMISSSFGSCKIIAGGAQMKSSLINHPRVRKINSFLDLLSIAGSL